jgi:hypothetical protein
MHKKILIGVVICCLLLFGTSSIQPITANKSIQAQEEQMKEDVNYIIDRLDEIKEKYELLKCKECNNLDYPIICALLLSIWIPLVILINIIYLIMQPFWDILSLQFYMALSHIIFEVITPWVDYFECIDWGPWTI